MTFLCGRSLNLAQLCYIAVGFPTENIQLIYIQTLRFVWRIVNWSITYYYIMFFSFNDAFVLVRYNKLYKDAKIGLRVESPYELSSAPIFCGITRIFKAWKSFMCSLTSHLRVYSLFKKKRDNWWDRLFSRKWKHIRLSGSYVFINRRGPLIISL